MQDYRTKIFSNRRISTKNRLGQVGGDENSGLSSRIREQGLSLKFSMFFLLVAMLTLAVTAPAIAQEADLLDILKSDAEYQQKAEACRKLTRCGTLKSVPTLVSLLNDEKMTHMARTALESMPYPEVGVALRDALGKVSDPIKVGIISSLAMRDDVEAVPALSKLLTNDDAGITQAAAKALGMIATPEAIKAVQEALAPGAASPGTLSVFCDALMNGAEILAKEGQKDLAIAVFDGLGKVPNTIPPIRAAALRGAILTRGSEQGLPLLLNALQEADDALFAAALRVTRELDKDEALTAAVAKELAKLTDERKIRLSQALGERCDAAAGTALMAAAKEGTIAVRVAALRAMTRIAYVPALELATQLALHEDKALAKAAQDTLSYFPGKEGDAAITAMLQSKESKARAIAVELVGKGALENPIGILMEVAKSDQEEDIRIVALKTLGRYASIDEIPGLLDLLLNAQAKGEVQAAEKALDAVCGRQKRTPTANVTIKEAVYGALPDGQKADVTKKVMEILASGATSVNAANTIFGDTAPGTPKSLRIDYTENGVLTSKTVKEGENLTLTTMAASPVIVDAFCAALDKAQGAPKHAVLRLLGSAASPKSLEAVRAIATGSDGELKDTALRTLCSWPSSDVLPTLMALVKTPPTPTVKVLALRGAVRLLKQSASGTEAHASLMESASTTNEKKAVLSALAQADDVMSLELVLAQFGDDSVKAEAIQAATAIAQRLGASAKEDNSLFNGKDLTGWEYNEKHWSAKNGVIRAHSDKDIRRTEYLWSPATAGDFYLSVQIKLEPNTCNSGIQFRTEKRKREAFGIQADAGKDVWGRLYDQGGRGKLDWTDRAEAAVKPGEWNRYEVLAIGPAIWTAINGQLGVACLDLSEECERSGVIAFQLHAGPPPTVSYKMEKLIHNPKVAMGELTAKELIAELKMP